MHCENYRFEDYRWESDITIWIFSLKREEELKKRAFVSPPNI